MRTLKELLLWGSERLEEAHIEEAKLDAWLLLEHTTEISRASYYGNPDAVVSQEKEQIYRGYIEERATHIPLQHITGVQEFMGFHFQVNEHVLVPRQDTEVLVEEVLEVLQAGERVLDMCTGSGCILLSLLKICKGTTGTGVDISREALAVAQKNAEQLGVMAHFQESDVFENVRGRYDVIVSNPPYIRTSVIEGLHQEVKLHDPMLALDGKEDGLFFYRKIIQEAGAHLCRDGRLYFEIGHDQGYDVAELMEDAGFKDVYVKKDLAGLDRVVSGHL